MALILLYHRVTHLPLDPQLLCVSPENFEEHLRILKKYYNTISLQDLIGSHGARKISRKSIVITFDDGYADNLYNAKPLLERYKIPSTVFVASGHIDAQCEFWWDELDRMLLQPGILPETLCLKINGRTIRWELGKEVDYSYEDFKRYMNWNVLDQDNPTVRHRIYRELCNLIRPLPSEKRQNVLDDLAAWSGSNKKCRGTHRPLSTNEALQLAEDGLVEIGAHTVSHPVLFSLPNDLQKDEIRGSKEYLENISGCPVTSFSYPYGSKSDYSPETVELVKNAGFSSACSNFAGVVWRGTDSFQLPRFLVRNWSKDEFARRLEEWLRG